MEKTTTKLLAALAFGGMAVFTIWKVFRLPILVLSLVVSITWLTPGCERLIGRWNDKAVTDIKVKAAEFAARAETAEKARAEFAARAETAEKARAEFAARAETAEKVFRSHTVKLGPYYNIYFVPCYRITSTDRLPESYRQQLDTIVNKMETDGEPEDSIRAKVADFKKMYGRQSERVYCG
jgi:hypothetical protein